jgi:hypothetical protein
LHPAGHQPQKLQLVFTGQILHAAIDPGIVKVFAGRVPALNQNGHRVLVHRATFAGKFLPSANNCQDCQQHRITGQFRDRYRVLNCSQQSIPQPTRLGRIVRARGLIPGGSKGSDLTRIQILKHPMRKSSCVEYPPPIADHARSHDNPGLRVKRSKRLNLPSNLLPQARVEYFVKSIEHYQCLPTPLKKRLQNWPGNAHIFRIMKVVDKVQERAVTPLRTRESSQLNEQREDAGKRTNIGLRKAALFSTSRVAS